MTVSVVRQTCERLAHHRAIATGVFLLLTLAAANRLLYPSANSTDLFPRWYGTRLLLHGTDPYGPDAAKESQRHRYGHVLSDYEIRDHRDQERFAYPLYVAFLLAPLSGVDFATARHVVWLGLAGATLLSVFIWAEAMEWRPPRTVMGLVGIIVLFSPISQHGLQLTNLSMLAAFLLACAVWCARNRYLFWSGALLAIATIKPQMALLPVVWLLLWVVSRWRERGRLGLGFLSVLGILMAASLLILPSWPKEFVLGLSAYKGYTSAPSAFDAMFGAHRSLWVAGPLSVILALAMWRYREADAMSTTFALVTAAAFAATAWIMPTMFDPFNQVLMLPSICLLGRYFHSKNMRRSTGAGGANMNAPPAPTEWLPSSESQIMSDKSS